MLALLGARQDSSLDPALRAAVAAVAVDWARGVASPGLAFVSDRVGGEFAEPEPDALPAALGELLAGHGGPVFLVAPDVPRLDHDLAAAALADFADGCALSFAPATDARPYLLALPSPRGDLLALLAGGDRHRDAIFSEVMLLGGDVGMLRSERRVVTPADARALALDPLVPAELRALAARRA